ncbi:MAG: hypothetical protein ACI4UX_03225 [Clostridia bacterium]
MGYITKTIRAIFLDETSNNTIPEEKLSVEDKKILGEMRRADNTENIENRFTQSLKAKKIRNNNLKETAKKQVLKDSEEVYGPAENYKGVFSDDKGKDRDER